MVQTGDSMNSPRLPASCGCRAWWMQMRSSRIKAVRGHHSWPTPPSYTHHWSPMGGGDVTFKLLDCGNFRTSSRGTVSRVLLPYSLRNVESDSTCCRLRGMSPSWVSAHLCSFFRHRAEFRWQDKKGGSVSRGCRNTHTLIHMNGVAPSMGLVRRNHRRLLFFLHLFPLLLHVPLLWGGREPLDGSKHNGLCSQVAVTHAVSETSHTLLITVAFIKGNANTS